MADTIPSEFVKHGLIPICLGRLKMLPDQDAVVIRAGSRRSLARSMVRAKSDDGNAGECCLGHGCAGVPAGPAHALLPVSLQCLHFDQLHRSLCQL